MPRNTVKYSASGQWLNKAERLPSSRIDMRFLHGGSSVFQTRLWCKVRLNPPMKASSPSSTGVNEVCFSFYWPCCEVHLRGVQAPSDRPGSLPEAVTEGLVQRGRGPAPLGWFHTWHSRVNVRPRPKAGSLCTIYWLSFYELRVSKVRTAPGLAFQDPLTSCGGITWQTVAGSVWHGWTVQATQAWFCEHPLLSEIYTNTYAGGGTVEGGVSGVELNTGLGTAAGLVAGGSTGARRRRSSTTGTQWEYADTGLNMAFLDSYFSEVIPLHTATQNSLEMEW